MIIVWLLIAVLLVLAALHAYWGLGGRWPGHDDTSMVQYVVGRTEAMAAPGARACFAVAFAILTTAVLAAHMAGVLHIPYVPQPLVTLGFWGAATVFTGRGLAAYVPGIFNYAKGTPFYRLNRILYSPLCLLIGAGFGAIGTKSI